MSNTQQPEALRLADKYEIEGFLGDHSFAKEQWCSQAAVELRRQHTRIAELEAQLSAIGAGGVEPLRKSAKRGVPLSDAEIQALYNEDSHWDMVVPYVLAFARAIEAAHGITQEKQG